MQSLRAHGALAKQLVVMAVLLQHNDSAGRERIGRGGGAELEASGISSIDMPERNLYGRAMWGEMPESPRCGPSVMM